ncbi:alpha/beta hydrolase family protein [Ereboglobus luteus]|uniref:Acetyl xylan esterase domain-containing protein n=1 Tax=Ereboglobus luteus TaxID=1796921 RepID=A0A2U8DZV5_9BACT|nr:acetylxylan esterase [Ereboglobus luteus]AWI08128.1 hypothetical protein CKA38_01610 [Ereboglobus luteus]
MKHTRFLSPFIIMLALAFAPSAFSRTELFSIPDAKDNPFEITVLSRADKGDAILEEIMFNGPPFNGAPTRIYAWLAYPKREGKYPGVVRLHGAGLKQALTSEAAVEYAQAGYVCLCIDWAGREEGGVKRPDPRSDFNAFGRIAQPTLGKDGKPVAGRFNLADPAADTITNGVRFVRRSLQFLRARPDVDSTKLCLSAMSAGAHLSLLTLAVEPDVKAAALKYGSGFVRELNWGGYFGRLGLGERDAAARWLSVLDPKHGLADIKTPTLLLSGTDDIFFFMPAVLATWRAMTAPKALLMLPNDNHSKVSNETIPRQWFESVMRGKPAWPRAQKMSAENRDGALVLSARCDGEIERAVFWCKRMPRAAFKYGRARKPDETVPWSEIAARRERDGAWTATIAPPAPDEQVLAYCMFETADGVRESSDTVELPAMPKWGRDLQPAAQAADGIRRAAVSFDRCQLDDDNKREWIREAGNLSGRTGENQGRNVSGWVEYDFEIARSGWHCLKVSHDGTGHEFLVDGKTRFYGRGPAIGGLWLDAGTHTLRLERFHWKGFAPITEWTMTRTPDEAPARERFQVSVANRHNALRLGEAVLLDVAHAPFWNAEELEFRLVEIDTGIEGGSARLALSSKGPARVEVRCEREGVFRLVCLMAGGEIPLRGVIPSSFIVVNTTRVEADKTAREPAKTLVAEIDCVTREPDFFRGGDTRVVQKSWGAYRESGDVGYLQHMNATEPSWFAYAFRVDDPDATYWMEFDYPDDARRTFVVVPRSGNPQRYAGPATGPDCGREFSLGNRMRTMGLYFWPLHTDLRAMVMQPQDGMRAAVSKIRIYKLDENPAPLPVAEKHGRDFIHWYEEGLSYAGFFGGDSAKASATYVSSENWARTMSHMGASMLLPTIAIYQMTMYPGRYNLTYADSGTDDAVRVLELMCEKYGLKFAGEFHPDARQLRWASARRGTRGRFIRSTATAKPGRGGAIRFSIF